ncbi:MAG: hypothetical protein AEth_01433 [Candidatus Argoarchaeum ethanivorans]|uniref:Uncharacterized protein n=1 Tax=Candidatus Argoarchaeum ethanivorans TaxID=2608793 RepID=A0A8B3S1R0_9EURY|nr:MAG: hypothetical protein AEth_01433 [Candidatus Argoarchaeum ethanivorans]
MKKVEIQLQNHIDILFGDTVRIALLSSDELIRVK